MPGGFSIYARLILPALGAVAGWFVFEEMIVAVPLLRFFLEQQVGFRTKKKK